MDARHVDGPCGQSFYVGFACKLGPRQICLSAGGDHLGDQGGVARILEILRRHISLGAADVIYQQVVRFSQCRRADQSMAEFIAEFDLLRREAGSKIEMSTGFPE